MMTRKTFKEIAARAKQHIDNGQKSEAVAVAKSLMAVQDNPRFDRGKFIAACGLTDKDL